MKAEKETKTHTRSKDTHDYNLKIYKKGKTWIYNQLNAQFLFIQ
jgi:hypothetical protein